MPLWLRKGLVAIVAVLTLGTVVPTSYLHTDTRSPKDSLRGQEQQNAAQDHTALESALEIENESETEEDKSSSWQKVASTCESHDELVQKFADFVQGEAVTQAADKFGPTIEDKIGDTYNQLIVPKLSKAMTKLSANMDESLLRHLEVTHNPAPGTGERILHFYDTRTGEEVVKFHVRRDKPPKDGYWFNFHYHTLNDGFETHHTIDRIYWGKNTPPQWAA